jgi:hypothetical protein
MDCFNLVYAGRIFAATWRLEMTESNRGPYCALGKDGKAI